MKGRLAWLSRLHVAGNLALCLIVVSCAPVKAPPQPAVSDLVEKSGFIFEGTVAELGAATVPGIPVSPHTAVVKVDKVLKGPPSGSGKKTSHVRSGLRQ